MLITYTYYNYVDMFYSNRLMGSTAVEFNKTKFIPHFDTIRGRIFLQM